MKHVICLIALFISLSSHAARKVETLVTCQQDDGDQWVEVGVVMNDGPGLRAIVLSHNDDNGEVKVLANELVKKSKLGSKRVFENAFQTLKLTISSRGELSLIKDGMGSFTQKNMNCIEHSSITF